MSLSVNIYRPSLIPHLQGSIAVSSIAMIFSSLDVTLGDVGCLHLACPRCHEHVTDIHRRLN